MTQSVVMYVSKSRLAALCVVINMAAPYSCLCHAASSHEERQAQNNAAFAEEVPQKSTWGYHHTCYQRSCRACESHGE